MAKEKFYCQCQMQRSIEHGHQVMVSWIPSDIAKIGNVVRLKKRSSDSEWSENWEVLSVGSKRPAELVESHERDYLYQRKASDV